MVNHTHSMHDHHTTAPPAAEEHTGHGGMPANSDAGGPAGHAGHDKHAGHDPEMFRRRLWLSFPLTIPVVVFSEMVQDWFGYSLSDVPGNQLVSPVLGAFIFVYGGHVFLIGGWREVLDRQPGMMLLISLAISVAFTASVLTTAGLLDLEFWWELAALITVMLLGHWQEMAAIGRTRGALAALAELLPDDAERVVDGGSEHVAIADLSRGDIVLVRPGGRVPADGTIVDGQAEFDESMITGESKPVGRSTGERVAAGTVTLGSSVRVRVDAVGEETALAGIQRMVAQAQASGSRAQALADKAAAALFYIAVTAGIITFAAWALSGDSDAAITRTITVLVIACPHALGLAIPLVIAISTEVSAHNGILVKDRLALERMRNIDVVLFDKTGTLTEGKHVVTGSWAGDGDSASMLRLAAAAESDSEHPLARAIVTAGKEQGQLPAASDFLTIPGTGIRAQVEGRAVGVGSPRLLAELGIDESMLGGSAIDEWRSRGASVLFVVVDGELAGAVALEDQVREVSQAAVDGLHGQGVRVAMITGDARNVADHVAGELGIDEVFADVLPEGKAEIVKRLQRGGERVAMAGDGVNDAPALALADVGIAMGTGTDVAMQSASVTLVKGDLRGIVRARNLSRQVMKNIRQNLFFAFAYNVLGVPIAAGILYPMFGLLLSPMIASAAMALSSVSVIGNALRLRQVAVD